MDRFKSYVSAGRGSFAIVGLIFAATGWAANAPPVMGAWVFLFASGIAQIAIFSYRDGR